MIAVQRMKNLPPIHELATEWKQTLLNLKTMSAAQVEQQSAYFQDCAKQLNIPALSFASDSLVYWKRWGVTAINVGGPMAGGKSSVADFILAQLPGWESRDSDLFHPERNIEKMRSNQSLTNEDRVPFLSGIQDYLSFPRRISTCSALTSGYRACLFGQDMTTSVTSYDPQASWEIPKLSANHGLLQILVIKPYADALEQLDASNTGRAPQRMFNGKPHFIKVTYESEAQAQSEGRSGVLKNQYDLLGPIDQIAPWEALVIEPQNFKSQTGEYDTASMLKEILALPFLT